MPLSIIGLALALGTAACADANGGTREHRTGAVADTVAYRAAAPAPRPPLTAEERAFYEDMARLSWNYLDKYYQPATGLVNATPDWTNTTVWDVGGQILAYQAAKQLGLIAPAEYAKRTEKLLGTLERAELFRGAAFNKLYSTTGATLERSRLGWSATDLGRLFLALKILAVHEPQYAVRAERIVRRNDFRQIVKKGYLHGQLIGSRGQPWTFQEGRIGYEHYVASGFSQWGADVRNALDVRRNARPVKVLGVELLQDTRSLDRLLSEPFILQGIELGLSGEMQTLARNVLAAQEARYRQTGQVTIVSEDALSVKPHYFYYYCVYCNRKPFVVDISSPGKELDSPRWVSTKAAFGWHALMPSEYTRTATAYVAKSKDPRRGYASGVFEKTGASTNTFDINTASVLLEIAFYQLRGGKPLIQP
ncbi:MAG TPA: DUF3131 domain-containing protein [Gemmatimonadaceae bacterium]|nr:DUF3131 domain-containing protein [Gemmatimonadaceae bacterium]